MRLQAILSHIYKFKWHKRFSGVCTDQKDIRSSTFKVLSLQNTLSIESANLRITMIQEIELELMEANLSVQTKVHCCKELYFANEDFYLDLSFERNHCRKFPSFQFDGLDLDY